VRAVIKRENLTVDFPDKSMVCSSMISGKAEPRRRSRYSHVQAKNVSNVHHDDESVRMPDNSGDTMILDFNGCPTRPAHGLVLHSIPVFWKSVYLNDVFIKTPQYPARQVSARSLGLIELRYAL